GCCTSWTGRAASGSGRTAGREEQAVVPHDHPALLRRVVEVLQVLDVRGRLGQALHVRVVRAHEDVAGPDQPQQAGQLVLVEGGDPQVPLERLPRILGEQVR